MDYATWMAKKLSRSERSLGLERRDGIDERLPLTVCMPLIIALSLTMWLAIALVVKGLLSLSL